MIARPFAVSVIRVPRGLTASSIGRPLGVGARVVNRDAPDLLASAALRLGVG